MEKFQDLISSNVPVVVDFYADWCGPCKAMSPVIKEVAAQVSGKARVLKVNIDKNEETARYYNIRSVPTLIIFKNGQQVWRHAGTIDKNTLKSQVLHFAQ
jgi:thioredoxin 1